MCTRNMFNVTYPKYIPIRLRVFVHNFINIDILILAPRCVVRFSFKFVGHGYMFVHLRVCCVHSMFCQCLDHSHNDIRHSPIA